MHLIVPDLYPLGIARKSGGGLHCHLHVRWSYRSPRGRYRNIDFRREELDGFHRISGEDDALFRLQRFIVDGGSFQGVRAFLVEKTGGGVSHQGGSPQHIEAAGSPGGQVDTGTVCLGCLRYLAIKEVVGQRPDRKGDNGSAVFRAGNASSFMAAGEAASTR